MSWLYLTQDQKTKNIIIYRMKGGTNQAYSRLTLADKKTENFPYNWFTSGDIPKRIVTVLNGKEPEMVKAPPPVVTTVTQPSKGGVDINYNEKLLNDPGLVGPKKLPKDFGMKPNDSHLIVNDREEWCRAFNSKGKFLWQVHALARGQSSETDTWSTGSDTPPGLYKSGVIYRDYITYGAHPSYTRDLQSYGWYSIDLIDLEGQERVRGRGGIMAHGGGSAAGWPGAWAPKQPLYPTLGCVRFRNIDLHEKVVPLYDKGDLFFSVYQEK